MLKRIDGIKTELGVMAGGLLGAIVAWSPTDSITWETQWVQLASAVIATWTGIAIKHAIKKSGPNGGA